MPLEPWQIAGAIIMIILVFIIAFYFEKKRPFEKEE